MTINPANRWKRLGGAMIDSLISLIIFVPVMFATSILQQISKGEGLNLVQKVTFFVVAWASFLILNGYLLFNRGQTIGNVVMSTKIVDLIGNTPNFGKLLVLRYLVPGIVTQITRSFEAWLVSQMLCSFSARNVAVFMITLPAHGS